MDGPVDREFPAQVIVETTAYCTQRCIHCAHKSLVRRKGSMETALFEKIVDEIAAEAPGTEVWLTFYGEALILRERLGALIRYAKARGLTNTVLNSNAMLLTRAAGEMLLDAGLDRFIVSMDGFTKETYERVRVGGNFEAVRDNVLGFAALLRERGAGRPRLELQFSVLEENRHELEDFNRFWRAQGVSVKNRPKASWAGRVPAPNLDPRRERVPCKWALNHAAILWDGTLVACGVDAEGGFRAGSVRERTLGELWRTTHRAFRRLHLERRWGELPEVCRGCLDWQTTDRAYYEAGRGA